MGKTLVLAEKPSVGRDIARVLGCGGNNRSYKEGSEYIVTWAMGHLVQLASPERYGQQYEVWSLETLPMIPNPFKLEVIGKTSQQYKQVKQLLHRKDVSQVVIATDAGREGELVARWILELAGCRKPIKRLWISSVTDQAIRNGFKHLVDGRLYEDLYQSAVARAEADWIVGLNASRALTCKFNDSLSCGRVQTPTLGIVNDRDQEIKHFKSEKLYGLTLQSAGLTYQMVDKKSQGIRSRDKNHIEAVCKDLDKGQLKITKVHVSEKSKYAQGLFDLTALQQEASSRYDFSAKETLRIMQGLYEKHKILTYPRTDSKYLTEDIVPTLGERLRSIQIGPFKPYVTSILKQPVKSHKSFVDNSKVTDHHGIIPTEEPVDLSALSAKEYKIYDLVVRRFLSVLMKPSKYKQTYIEATCGNQNFSYKEARLVEAGFEALYEKVLTDSANVGVKSGMSYPITSIKIDEADTKPPSRFTEGTLLGAMENPGKYMDAKDARLKKTLKETGGLGTVATRADIIEKLFNHNYMEKKGKYIYMTSRGKQLLSLVPEALKKPDLTADWELQLKHIAAGKVKKAQFIETLIKYTRTAVTTIKSSDAKYKHDNVVSEKCPDCGGMMLSKDSKHGKSLVCSDRNCGYRKNISKATNARCPKCHKKLSLVGEGEGKRFVCKCGYKETMGHFNEKRKKKKQQMGKRDVNRYLNKQSKEDESFNNPFKDLLGKLD